MYVHTKKDHSNKKYKVVGTKAHTNGYTLYKILVKEFVASGSLECIKESVSWKRYSDFRNLHKALFIIHRDLYLPGKFPGFVKPKLFGRFDNTVIEERVKCIHDLLDFTSRHKALYASRVFEGFFKNSTPLEKSAELAELKEVPMQPEQSSSTETSDQVLSMKKTLNEDDLRLFDPCLSGHTDTSDEAAQNDWLAVVRSAAAVNVNSSTQRSHADPQPDVIADREGVPSSSASINFMSNDINAGSVPKEVDTGTNCDNDLNSARKNLSEDEIAAFDSVQETDSSEPSMFQAKSRSDVTTDAGDSQPSYPNYDAFRDTSVTSNFSVEQSSQEHVNIPSSQALASSVGTAREEHRRSSKARAYLNQLLEHNKASNGSTTAVAEKPNLDAENAVAQSLTQLPKPLPKSNLSNDSKSFGPMRKSSEPFGESKGSLLDLKRFFLDDIDDEQKGAYLVEAAKLISAAHNAESGERYRDAVSNYKSAVSMLLQGVQDDTDEIRIQAVRRKTAKYLKKVEEIHDRYLKNMVNNSSLWTAYNQTDQGKVKSSFDDADDQRDRSSSNEPVEGTLEYNRVSRLKDKQTLVSSPRHTSQDLMSYKVLGVIGKVLLVLDSVTDFTYVIKVLQKSSVKRSRLRKAVIPTNVPYMVKLHRFYSTENCIYLVLEYASGGKLWDQLSTFIARDAACRHRRGSKFERANRQSGGTAEVVRRSHEHADQPRGPDLADAKPVDLLSLPASSQRDANDVETINSATTKRKESLSDTRHPKLKSSWSFLSDDTSTPALAADESDVPHRDSKEELDFKEASTTDGSHMFTIDSVGTLSDAEDGKCCELQDDAAAGVTVTLNDEDDAFEANESDECFASELLSEQDLSSVTTLCDQDNRTSTPSLLRSTEESSLNKSSDTLHVSNASPAISLHSSTDVDDVISEARGDDVGQTSVVVNRFVNEHGISTADPSLIFRSPRSKSVSTIERGRSQNDASSPLVSDCEEVCGKEVSTFEDQDKITENNTETNSTFSLFRRMTSEVQKALRIPESLIQRWGAELIVAIGTLHSVGILCRSLNPEKILLSADGHIRLTYFSKWKQVDPRSTSYRNTHGQYCAPEVSSVSAKKTEACDWWSLGALLYELLVGKALHESYPGDITSHTILTFPEFLSNEAKSLLTGLLAYHPTQRLGYGVRGLDDLMSHPFFKDTEWDELIDRAADT